MRGCASRGCPARAPLDPLFVYLCEQKVLWGDKAPRSSGGVRREAQCRFMGVKSGEQDKGMKRSDGRVGVTVGKQKGIHWI